MNKISPGDEIELYPSQKLIDSYNSGKTIEEVRKEIDSYDDLDETAKRLGKYIAEEFYRKWETEDGE